MEIRLLTENDAAQYWTLRLEALQKNPEAFATSYEEALGRVKPLEGLKQSLANEHNDTFGAFDGELLVGMVTLLRESATKLNHRANIFAMYVSTEFRGAKVGKALMLAAINRARSIESVEKLNLSVVSTNEPAKRLYSNLGFRTFGVEEKALKVGNQYFDEEHMVLFL